MLRLHKSLGIPRGLETQIASPFVRLLASEAMRLRRATARIVPDDNETSVRVRYAPMQRLLSHADEQYLQRRGCFEAALKLRREHRQCYREFLSDLRRDIREVRRLRGWAMASAGIWDFWSLFEYVLLSESSLAYLRWLGWKHSAGIGAAAGEVTECLNFLLVHPKLRVEAT